MTFLSSSIPFQRHNLDKNLKLLSPCILHLKYNTPSDQDTNYVGNKNKSLGCLYYGVQKHLNHDIISIISNADYAEITPYFYCFVAIIRIQSLVAR